MRTVTHGSPRLRVLAALALIVGILAAGCTTPALQKPTVTVDGVTITRFSLTEIDLELRITVHNPNPVGATMDRVEFDLFFFDDGEQRFLGHGEQTGISIRKQGDTSVAIPLTINNIRLVQAVLGILDRGSLTLKVSGTAAINFGTISFDVPFERTTEVALQ